MKKFKRFALAVAVLLGGIGGSFAAAAPAQAAYADCLNGYVCLWTDAYYGGSLYQWTPGYIRTLPNRCLYLSSGISAKASSIAGKYGSVGSPVTFYGVGGSFGRDNNFSDSNLGDTSGIVGWNNRIDTICVL